MNKAKKIKEALESLQKIKETYDAYFMVNRYCETKDNTHFKEFHCLANLLKGKERSLSAIGWIIENYDCYYKDEEPFTLENDENPFYYLETQIKKVEEEK